MATLIYEMTGRAGLAHKHQGDLNDSTGAPQLRYQTREGQVAGGIFNPLRTYGYMSPATNAFVSITEADGTYDPEAVLAATIIDPINGDYYLAEAGRIIWSGTSGMGDNTLNQVGDLTTTGSPIITDLEIYQINGTKKIFYSYAKSGGGDVGMASLPFGTADNDWLSAAASGGAALDATAFSFMRVADNGYMYIFEGPNVHKIDGTTAGGANGTASMNELNFPVHFEIVDAVDYKGSLFIAIQSTAGDSIGGLNEVNTNSTYEEQITGVYVWDRLSTVVRSRDYIPVRGVKHIFRLYVDPNGELRMLCRGSDRMVQVRRFNGVTFTLMQEVGLSAQPKYHDSVIQMGGLTVWMGGDGIFYGHGSVAPGEPEGLFKLGTADSLATNAPSSALLLADDNASSTTARQGIIFGFENDSNDFVYRRWHPHGTGTISSVSMVGHVGNVYFPVRYVPKLATIEDIVLFCAPTTSSGATVIATIKIYFNQSTTAFKSFSVTQAMASRGYVHIPINKPYCNAVQIEVEFSITQALGADDFRPSFAEIHYSPSSTLR